MHIVIGRLANRKNLRFLWNLNVRRCRLQKIKIKGTPEKPGEARRGSRGASVRGFLPRFRGSAKWFL
eukprot:1326443-Amphidinium_carterae.1